jgi:transcription elongation factor Elf1
MAIQKNYETKPMTAAEPKIAKPIVLVEKKEKCPLAHCGSENVITEKYEKITIVKCLTCGYAAKYIDGRIV